MNVTVLSLNDYEVCHLVHQSDRTLVYRGRSKKDSQPVAIKLMRNEYPSFNELVQFRNQYTIAKNLDIEGIIKPHVLERYENRYALIMEDFGGIALDEVMGNGRPLPLTIPQFLPLAIQLAEILHHLHQNFVIHKDIKPANILIHPETQQVKLIDFSISSLLPKETQTIQTPNILEGTLAYISPEQTGRMNRGIDYRSDFYSLGVTFYELLNGKRPFESNDPLELVHCHIAKIAPPLENEGNIPKVIADIAMKLMAKNAEDRYQSALGLKYDLEKCLNLWQETGKLEQFELGERDICDRFLIPEKLYGREAEVQTLLDAFVRVSQGKSEILLVAGYSGVGKTAVVNEVHKPIVEKRGYFIKGKYDQFQRNIPLTAFVQAFRDLMGQLLGESDAQLQRWQEKILTALGESGRVIIEVIPELEKIIGEQPSVPELEGSAAQNRFNLLFQKFVRVFATAEHPLTIFIDDLQWADSASLNLLKLLMSESEAGYLLVLGAYRDNEVFPAHPLMLTGNELHKQGVTLETLTLEPLSEVDITCLVADTLQCSVKIAAPLSELVYQKTKGNPFFTTQFLQGLHEDGWIAFESKAGYWQCDLKQVRQLALTDDVVAFMVGRLRKLPEATRAMLKLAACIGNQFDLATLAVTCESSQEQVARDLWPALSEGFAIPENETYKFFQGDKSQEKPVEEVAVGYRFLHDRVQQAAYSLIPEEEKPTTHYRIGRLLLERIPRERREERIFEIAGQLNYGKSLIAEQSDRDELAQLNLIASRRARSSTAYQAGREYIQTGLLLLAEGAWHRQYEMTLAFHDLGAELASLSGDFEAMEEFVETAIARSRTLLERVNAYRIRIQANVYQTKLTEAIAIGRQLLKQFGIALPEAPTREDGRQASMEIGQLLGEREIEDLIHLPVMTDGEKIAIVRVAHSIMAAAYMAEPLLLPLLATLAVKLSIQYGNTPVSASAYSFYGLMACNFLEDVEAGVKFGQLAFQVASKLNAKAIQPEVSTIAGCLLHRKFPVKETLSLQQETYTSGLEVGSLEFVGYAAHNFCMNSFWCGQSLAALEQKAGAYCHALMQLNQGATANYCRIHWQSTLNLLGAVEEASILSGEAFQKAEYLPSLLRTNDLLGLYLFYIYELMLTYLFGDIESARHNAIEAGRYLMAAPGLIVEPEFHFYDSLVALAWLSLSDSSDEETEARSQIWQRVEQNQTQLQDIWARYAPMNHQHKADLVAAEKCRVLGQKAEAIELYDRAISGAKENEYVQEEALANELAAKFYLDWGKEKMAATYMTDAYYCYARWGAKAKTDQLEAKYPQLLAPILQQPRLQLQSGQTVTSTLTRTTSSSSSTTGLMLDWATAMKAAQSLSSEIHLDKLVSALMKAALENAGADGGILLLKQQKTWQVAARSVEKTCQLHSTPALGDSNIPGSVINKVKRSIEAIIVNDFPRDTQFSADPYLLQEQPKSFLCAPILNQGKLIGILYLENRLAVGAFTSDRVSLLNLLCSQAAISLENARLYEQSQDYAEKLEQSLADLQIAQLQLVQSEKMSALGNLVAGVAHEINNPVGFIAGNLDPARDYLQDLFGLLDLYQQKYPHPDPEIEAKIEGIDLEFLREDLPQLISSMREGTDRIRHISTSLRTFSRADKEHKVPFDLHQGIDSTLLILKHRLKANEERPEIEVVKDYGNLPSVQCFPGQLNQVFMNLIANAIDALEEASQGRTRADLAANPNRILIQTKQIGDRVLVKIADNGTGMPSEVKQRIFEQGFTTKAVGKGTGLGMAIAKSIVEEKHGGAIACHSELGQGTEFTISLPVSQDA